MPVLLALSILAFVALLWATISIAGFVRRARRRRRRRLADAAELRAGGIEPNPAGPTPSAYLDPEAPEAPDLPRSPQALERTDAKPPAVSEPSPPPPPPGTAPPPRLRSFPTRLGNHTPAAPAPDDARARWNPFHQDFADLTDPAAASRRPPAKRLHKP